MEVTSSSTLGSGGLGGGVKLMRRPGRHHTDVIFLTIFIPERNHWGNAVKKQGILIKGKISMYRAPVRGT